MFSCHACVRRLFAIVAPDVPVSLPLRPDRALRTACIRSSRTRRQLHAAVAAGTTSLASEKPTLTIQHGLTPHEHGHKGKVDGHKRDMEPSTKSSAAQTKRLEHTLKFLVDPLRLSEYVQRQLKKNKVEDALQITRFASSRQMNATVAWNFIIDWHIKQGKTNAAVKVFNEMKKRAQVPDAYTYSVLLRGLAQYADRPNAIQKALSVYNSMYGPSSKVQPKTVHANLLLKFCADVGDMDNLWAIAGKLGEGGPAGADERTYSIILRAEFQHAVENIPPDAEPEQLARHFEQSVVQGRRLWVDIVQKWRKGQLRMDEELTRCMGRILLLSYRPRDWDDVFSLVEQTQNIPRMIGIMGTERHLRAHAWSDTESLKTTGNIPQDMQCDIEDHKQSVRGSEFLTKPVPSTDSTKAERLQRGRGTRTASFASPGKSTLSLLMEACQKLGSKKAADDYWHLLTSGKYNIEPDHDNYKCYLRVLRQSHSSAQVVQLLKTGYSGAAMGHDLFRLSIATCVRDKNNVNALGHATEIMLMMRDQAKMLDPVAISAYVKLATDSKDPIRVESAIRTVESMARHARQGSLMSVARDISMQTIDVKQSTAESFWTLCNTIIRSIDWLLEQKVIPKKEEDFWHNTREDFKKCSKLFGSAAQRHRPGEGAPQSRPDPQLMSSPPKNGLSSRRAEVVI